jgi:DegV family protein with EDD domain
MSGTYSTAELVRRMVLEEYPNARIKLIDSTSNSMQLGFAVLAAAKVAKAGGKLEEVVTEANNNILRSKFIFIPDTLEYLRIGGRIGTASALIGSLLQVKPILTVVDGSTAVISKIRTKKSAMEEMLQIFLRDIERFGIGEAIVHHINVEGEAQKFAAEIKKYINQDVATIPIGPVIGTHVGPGAIGIAYYTKEEIRV